MPKVSVIIPTFNRSAILKQTIDSVLAQTFTDFEILVVSNGSTDDTETAVKAYQDPRIKYFYQIGTGSPASPRNNGIRNSKGEYIAFCDDDDLWLPNKLEKQIDFMSKNPDYGLCYTKMKRFNADRQWINPAEETDETVNSKSLLYRNVMPLSSILIRKSVLEQAGPAFDESKQIAGTEDYELWLRCSKLTKIFGINEYLVMYYSGDNRFTNKTSTNMLMRNLKYLKRIACVYKMVVKKGYFKYRETFYPFLINTILVSKLIVYDFKLSITR